MDDDQSDPYRPNREWETFKSQAALQPTKWGQLIRQSREARGLSIPQAARGTGVSPSQWGNIERGYQKLGRGEVIPAPGMARNVAHMAAEVGVSPDRLRQAGRGDAADIEIEILVQRHRSRDEPVEDDPLLQQIRDHSVLTDDQKRNVLALIEDMLAADARQRGA